MLEISCVSVLRIFNFKIRHAEVFVSYGLSIYEYEQLQYKILYNEKYTI